MRRKRQPVLIAKHNSITPFFASHTLGGVNKEPSAMLRVPTAVLDVLSAVDDQPSPRLSD
ncbi:hypothetical protein EMIT0215P_50133 [Pseudomonas serboccidentalis]